MPVDVQPKPALIAKPPRNGPSALAALKALLLSAPAMVCASGATSISRTCSKVPMAPPMPMSTTSSDMVRISCAASGNSASITMLQSSRPAMQGISFLPTAKRGIIRLPSVMPTPKSASTSGTTAADTLVTSISVEAI